MLLAILYIWISNGYLNVLLLVYLTFVEKKYLKYLIKYSVLSSDDTQSYC